MATCHGKLPLLAGLPFVILVDVTLLKPHSGGISTFGGQSFTKLIDVIIFHKTTV